MFNYNNRYFLIGLLLVASLSNTFGQKAALKTNLVADATTTMSLALEVGTAPRNTLDLYVHYNPWELGNGKLLKHFYVQPEYRFWFCDRFSGSFLGVHLHGGLFNLAGWELPFNLYPGLKDHRYEGEFVGGGVSYGYQWVLSRHWNFEANIGAGYAYINYDRYQCGNCGKRLDKDRDKNYFGPTKAALSLIYVF